MINTHGPGLRNVHMPPGPGVSDEGPSHLCGRHQSIPGASVLSELSLVWQLGRATNDHLSNVFFIQTWNVF